MNGFLSIWDTFYGEQIRGAAEEGLMCVIDAAVAAVPLAAVVTFVNLFFRRWISAGQMGLLWCLVFVRLLLPAAPASPFSLHNLLPQEHPMEFELPQENSTVRDYAAEGVYPLTAVVQPAPAPDLLDPSQLAVDPEDRLDFVTATAELVWLAAAVGIIVWTLFANWRFCRFVRRTPVCSDERLLRLWGECCEKMRVHNSLPVVVFDGVDQPAVMGLWRAKLLLPSHALKLSDDELQMIMLHELAHVRRWDIAINWGLALLRAVHWWNPIYWLAAGRFQNLREQACDAYVIRILDGKASRGYGELLLNLAENSPAALGWRVMVPASLLGFLTSYLRKRALRTRLTALRRAGIRYSGWHTAAVGALVVVAALCGLTDAQTPAPQPRDAFGIEHWFPKGTDWHNWVVGPKKEASDQPLVTRTYAVDEMIGRIPRDGRDDEPSRMDIEWFVKMMLNQSRNSSERSQEEGSAASEELPPPAGYHWEGDQLIVRAPSRVHDELATLIAAWQTSGIAQISIECRMMTFSRELATAAGIEWKSFGAVPAIHEEQFPPPTIQNATVVQASSQVEDHVPIFVVPLNGQQVMEMTQVVQSDARGNLMFAPKITLFNGQQAVVGDLVQRPFVVGIEEQPGQAAKPRVEVIEEGTKLTLRTVLNEDRKRIQLSGRIELSNIIDIGQVSAVADGKVVTIQAPRVSRRRISVAAQIEDGQSLLIGCLPHVDQRDFFYVLLTVRHIVLPKGE